MKREIDKSSRILVTGGSGLVGSALMETLLDQGFERVLSVSSKDCDLADYNQTKKLFHDTRPDYVFHLAAKAFGIGGNYAYKSDVLVENTRINTNVVDEARVAGVRKIVAVGSVSIYPKFYDDRQLLESDVWQGPPHPSQDSYGHSKRMMLAHLDAARHQYGLNSAFVISSNVYGPHGKFDEENGHVIQSLIAKFYNAKMNGFPVIAWGTGAPVRDFSHNSDLARALIQILESHEGPINFGSRQRKSIKHVVELLSKHVDVPFEWDISKPDGPQNRFCNLDLLTNLGFESKIPLDTGILDAYEWYVEGIQRSNGETQK